MSDERGRGKGSGYSTPAVNDEAFGSSGSHYAASHSNYSPLDSLSSYDKASASLEASISASARTTGNQVAGCLTEYVGLFGSAITPVGGGDIAAGFYSDCYGMVGAYFSVGPAAGIPSVSLGIAAGRTTSLSGESVSVSACIGYGPFEVSGGGTINPSTGQNTGEQLSLGLSLGLPIGASTAFTSTATTEFSSLYLGYIQFLNWVGYSGGGGDAVGGGDAGD